MIDFFIRLYTGPAKEKTIAVSIALILTISAVSGLIAHSIVNHEKLSDTAYAVGTDSECTTVFEASATDAVPTEESTTPPETTSAETTSLSESTTAPQETSSLTLIPVSDLDISEEDLSTNQEIINRTQANAAPASGLQDITAPNDYTSHTGFLTGIDVSKHQGTINWTKVKNDGIDFAMIKVAGRGYETGKLYYDTQYKANLSGAAAAGIKTGAYFFSQATTVQEAREEASMIIDALKGYNITYPVVFDWETAKGYRTYSGISKSTMTEIADTFCRMVEAAGYKAMIYANTFDFERFDAGSLTSSYGSWLARYPAHYNSNGLRFKAGDGLPALDYPYQIWQYSSTGRVNGISENVDMNVAFVDFSGTGNPKVPMFFDISTDAFYTQAGTIPDILTNIRAFNCAGMNETNRMTCTITNAAGMKVSLENAACTAGKYTVTYALKDFTGYTGYKSLPLYVQAAPVISLGSTNLTVSRLTSYDELLLMIKDNLISACDFTGTNLYSYVEIKYPDSFYETVYEEFSQETTTAPEEPSSLTDNNQNNTGPEEEETTEIETQETETTEIETAEIETTEVRKLIPGNYNIIYSVTDSYGFTTSMEASLVITE